MVTKNQFYEFEEFDTREETDYMQTGYTIVKDSDLIRGVKNGLRFDGITDIHEYRSHDTHDYYLTVKTNHDQIWGDHLLKVMFRYNLHIDKIIVNNDQKGLTIVFEIYDYKETFNRHLRMINYSIKQDKRMEKLHKKNKKVNGA